MRRADRGPAHYEVELRRPDPSDSRSGTSWRAIRRVLPDGSAQPLRFARLVAARAYAERTNPGQVRVVAVEHDGWRRTVDAAET
jgi:hypothetical protein